MSASLLTSLNTISFDPSRVHRVNGPFIIKLYRFSDLAIALLMLFGVLMATNLRRTPSGIEEFLALRVTVKNLLLLGGFCFVWPNTCRLFGLYNLRLDTHRNEIIRVIKACSLASVFVMLFPLTSISGAFSFRAVIFFWALTATGSIMSRSLIRYSVAVRRRLFNTVTKEANRRHVLIIGTNRRAIRFAQRLESRPDSGYRIVGFADDEWAGSDKIRSTGHLVTDLSGVEEFLRHRVVDEAAIYLPARSYYSQMAHIINVCKTQGIVARLPAIHFDTLAGRTSFDTFEGEPVARFYTGSINGWQIYVKRGLDIVISAVLLAILFPVFVGVVILIKLTSPGPAFFINPRLGLNKRRFRMIKFRTMVQQADKVMKSITHLNNEVGPGFKIKNDPRVTAVGRFLRKTSIDELPQLINVLKGEMSLVGPRPLTEWEFVRIQDDFIIRRFSVKPGLTGLWQISGRSNLNFDERIKLDLHYIDNWSLLLDCRLLLKTIPVVISCKGAV